MTAVWHRCTVVDVSQFAMVAVTVVLPGVTVVDVVWVVSTVSTVVRVPVIVLANAVRTAVKASAVVANQ